MVDIWPALMVPYRGYNWDSSDDDITAQPWHLGTLGVGNHPGANHRADATFWSRAPGGEGSRRDGRADRDDRDAVHRRFVWADGASLPKRRLCLHIRRAG